MKLLSHSCLSVALLSLIASPSFAGVSFSANQVEVVVPPTCSHAPVSFTYTPSDVSYNESQILVSSDSAWATPSVDTELNRITVSFSMESLISSYTATIEVDDGESVAELFVHAEVTPLNVYRLVDDPARPRVYGIQKNGVDNGSIIAFDPYDESFSTCLTVGKNPTDFVINDDASELLVINSVDQTIDIIGLDDFSIIETIPLPVYGEWGASSTAANIELGPDNIIYYTDGAWAPKLHVLRRAEGDVIQSTLFFDSFGFMDFAVTSDNAHLVGMPQYGWSAGSHVAKIGHMAIAADGTVSLVKSTTLTSFAREPFQAPALLRDDAQVAVMKTVSVNPADTDDLDRTFSSPIWSMSPNGRVVATGDKLYDYDTGLALYEIPGGTVSGTGYLYTKAQAFTSDYSRFVYFDNATRSLKVVNLIEEIGLEAMGVTLAPGNGAVVNSPESLQWSPLSGVGQYDLYLSTDYAAVESADVGSFYYLGRVSGSSYTLPEPLDNGTVYYWRVDPVTASGPLDGPVYSFTVSEISLSVSRIDGKTVVGNPDYQFDIQLASQEPGVAWSAEASDPWISFTENSGVTPATLRVHLNASLLDAGQHSATFSLTSSSGTVQVPVSIRAEKLAITHIRSDRTSAMVYAISENTADISANAYLLEIDSSTESIVRTVEVGSSVTDVAIHYPDNLIYVTNWKSGSLLSVDKSDFSLIKSIAFEPAGATGYSEGDVYRVAAGVSQRIVVEEEDQWINISLFNSNTETSLDTDNVREGGGAFDPTGRYYYHGENNSSGASILKYDTAGDIFTELTSVRPTEISSYYGSRTVLVSENGSRVFWAGAVLDANLSPVWGVGEIVYATSPDGRFAFADDAIYDINLRRQTLAMPISTTVSGFNSTTEKLVVQVDDRVRFYSLSTPVVLPAPVLSAGDTTYESAVLNWIDNSLEMAFVIQQRLHGTSIWSDVKTTTANITSTTITGLSEGETYEFRVRASSSDYSSAWSNIVSATALVKVNQPPVAIDDVKPLAMLASTRFNIIHNDFDSDGLIDADTVTILDPPQYGNVVIHAGGDVSYIPGYNFVDGDSFTYQVSDDDGAVSEPAVVTITFNPPAVLTVISVTNDTVTMTWTDDNVEDGYYLQSRVAGYPGWYDMGYMSAYEFDRGVTVTGLVSGSSYEFRIRAAAVGVNDIWSNIVSARTSGSPPPKAPKLVVEKGAGAFGGTAFLFVTIAAMYRRRRFWRQ